MSGELFDLAYHAWIDAGFSPWDALVYAFHGTPDVDCWWDE
jgi:hypothetical protein